MTIGTLLAACSKSAQTRLIAGKLIAMCHGYNTKISQQQSSRGLGEHLADGSVNGTPLASPD